MKRVLVVGGSVAAVTAAETLRNEGFGGSITILSDEKRPPYARPPLSKAVLAGRQPPGTAMIAPLGDGIALRLDCRAVALDVRAACVVLDGGERVPYDGLAIACGARARAVSGAPPELQARLRSYDDCLRICAALEQRPDVLIIGAGLLGLEVASTCRALGLHVTVITNEPPLRRVLGEPLARLLCDAALDAGVKLRLSPGGVSLTGRDRVRGARLADGTEIEADLVLVAVGDEPNIEWLRSSGLTLQNGVIVDERCQAAPGIVAAGDVVAMRRPDGGPPIRTPHWDSAINQARTAANTLLHGDAARPVTRTPYFWTEQFGVDLKVCGDMPPRGTLQVVEGSIADRCALLQWAVDNGSTAAATINHRMPIARLRGLATPSRAERSR
jgi:NADPH-dependent 2,4-dienoyl-CoA reductase/sulfur reductase-like enzyme